MRVTIIVVAAAAVVLVIAAIRGSLRGRTSASAEPSSLRDAFVGILMTVGPFFGVRYQPPRVEIPVVMAPAGDDLDPATAPARLDQAVKGDEKEEEEG